MEMFCIGALAGMVFTIFFIFFIKVTNNDGNNNDSISNNSNTNSKLDGLDTRDNSKFKDQEKLEQLTNDLYVLRMTGGLSTLERDMVMYAIEVIDLYTKLIGEN